jgi:hypothetical protein
MIRNAATLRLFLAVWLLIGREGFPAMGETKPVKKAADSLTIEKAGLPPRTVMERLPLRPIPDWLRTSLRVGHLPPAGWRMVDEYLKAGYNVLTVNALRKWDIVGPTAALYPAPEVHDADAYLRRYVQTVHAAGAKAIFYIGPVQVAAFSPEFVKAHPDWLRVRPNGKPDPTPNFANIRSGYADWLLKQLAYVTREYKPDGFWLDGYAPVHLHTFDEQTRRLFHTDSGGKEIPAPPGGDPNRYDLVKDPLAREYLAWHEKYFVTFADRMRAVLRKENPEAVLFVNHSANRTWYFSNLYMGEYPGSYSSAVDVSSVELYWDVPGDALYQQFVYAFMQGVTQERGASVWIQPSAHGISGVSSPVEIQLRGLEGLPWGVTPEFVEGTGREEYLRLHVENMKARDRWLAKSEAIPYIGIVASEQTRALYAQGALPVYFSHTLGAFRALFEKHWPVRVLNEYDLEDADLHGVRVLVLPNVACLSDRAAEVIRRFVAAGGGLVATFETSLYDADFKRRPDFALADLFHAQYVATHPVAQRTDNLALTLTSRHPIVNDPLILGKQNTSWRNPDGPPPEQGPLALIASAAEVKAREGGEILATYDLPGRSPTRYPAIVASSYGKGRVVYFPASVDKGMFFYPDTYMRQMLANACRWAAGETSPPVEVAGPLILAATFRRQPEAKRTIVHLLNHGSSWGMHSIYQKLAPLPEELQKQWGFPNQSELRGTWPVREEVIPLHDIKVLCRIPGVRKATLQPENLDLPLTRIPGGVQVTVPKIEMHSMVVFE